MKVTHDETAMSMVLYNGYSYNEMPEKDNADFNKKYPFRKDFFKEQTIVVSLSGFDLERTEIDLFKSHSAMKNIAQLTYDIDSLNKRYNTRVNSYYTEFDNSILYAGRARDVVHHQSDTPATSENNKFETETAYNLLSDIDKKAVLTRAISNLKETANYLTTKNESLHSEVKFIKGYEVNWNKKFTLSFACLVFFFIGAPLGAIIRKGGLGTPAVISILFFVIWYVVSLSGEKLVEENLVSTFAGMWASSYILLPIGLFLTYKASNDSVILNIDTYISFLRKIKDYLYRILIQGNQRNSVSKKD
jgi:lipopolysaccharide export system permease protein